MMRETKQSQGTIALILWFAFFNAQLMMAVLLFMVQRIADPRVAVSEMVFWRPELIQDPLVLALMAVATTTGALGLGLGFRYFGAVRAAAEDPAAPKAGNQLFVLALVLCEVVGLQGVLIGFIRKPPTLGLPFLGVAMILLASLAPLGGRFPKPR